MRILDLPLTNRKIHYTHRREKDYSRSARCAIPRTPYSSGSVVPAAALRIPPAWCSPSPGRDRAQPQEDLPDLHRGGAQGPAETEDRSRMRVAPLLVPTRRNECWSVAFMQDSLATGRRFRLLTIVDDLSGSPPRTAWTPRSREPAWSRSWRGWRKRTAFPGRLW